MVRTVDLQKIQGYCSILTESWKSDRDVAKMASPIIWLCKVKGRVLQRWVKDDIGSLISISCPSPALLWSFEERRLLCFHSHILPCCPLSYIVTHYNRALHSATERRLSFAKMTSRHVFSGPSPAPLWSSEERSLLCFHSHIMPCCPLSHSVTQCHIV